MAVTIPNILTSIRLMCLVFSVAIVLGSLGYYSMESIPLRASNTENDNIWLIQTITDRRLISTLVAAQASIFCPLFILLSKTEDTTESFVEMACHFLMPIGLALSWVFSMLFDLKSTKLTAGSDICLDQSHCFIFMTVYILKFVVVGLFGLESIMVTFDFFTRSNRKIQLPVEDIEKSINNN